MVNRYIRLWLGAMTLASLSAQAQNTLLAPIVTYSAGGTPRNLAVADVNADGKPDVLTANSRNNNVSVLLGNGDGTFRAATTYSTGADSNPYDVAVADVNSDGKLDLLTANYTSNSAGVLLGNGNGTFQAATSFPTGATNGHPVSIAVADVTGDGKLDLITANYTSYTSSLFEGTGTGNFTATSIFYEPTSIPVDVVTADINRDGRSDVLIANAGSNTIAAIISPGGNYFNSSRLFPVGMDGTRGIYTPYSLTVADIDADGQLDIVTANTGAHNLTALLNTGSSFRPAIEVQTWGGPTGVAAADLNADGQVDLLSVSPTDVYVGVLLGSGRATFQPLTLYRAIGSNVSIVVADVNGDGRPDVLTGNEQGTVGVLLNTSAMLSNHAVIPGVMTTLHPNPAANYAVLTLSGLPASVAQVRATLLDAAGRVVRQQTLATTQSGIRAEVATTELATGLYLLQLVSLDAQGTVVGSLPSQRLSVH